MQFTVIAGLMAFAYSSMASPVYTPKTQDPGNKLAIYTPDLKNPVPKGKPYKITWDSASISASSKLNIYLLEGPSANLLEYHTTIVEGCPNTGEFIYTFSPELKAKKEGYGLRIDEVGTDEFQYSTPFEITGSTTTPNDKVPDTTTPADNQTDGGKVTTQDTTYDGEISTSSDQQDQDTPAGKPYGNHDSSPSYGDAQPVEPQHYDEPTVIYSTHVTTVTACDCSSTPIPDSTGYPVPGHGAPPPTPSGTPFIYGNSTAHNTTSSYEQPPEYNYKNAGTQVKVGGAIIAMAAGFVVAFL